MSGSETDRLSPGGRRARAHDTAVAENGIPAAATDVIIAPEGYSFTALVPGRTSAADGWDGRSGLDGNRRGRHSVTGPGLVPGAGGAESAATRDGRTPGGIGLFDRRLQPSLTAVCGWRGRLNRLSGGSLNLVPSRAESRERALRAMVLRPNRRAMAVMVANPKGGATKTPVTLLTAATFGQLRGGYTLAWDNNETRGTLGLRAEPAPHGHNVVDLLHHLELFTSTRASVGALGDYIRPQTAHCDVLASDEVPGRMEQIDGEAFARLYDVLSRYYRLLVIDTGNNVRAENWQAAARVADCLVVPTTVRRDVADTGLWMLEHLRHAGRADLVSNAVVIVSCAAPRVDRRLLAQIVAHYNRYVRAVRVVPFDPLIADGGEITYDALSAGTRRAWLEAGAAVAESLTAAEDDDM